MHHITSNQECSAPNNAKPVWSNPLILFIHQAISSTEGEQTVKSLLKAKKLVRLHIHNSGKLSMAI
jgi:hypothetical protein